MSARFISLLLCFLVFTNLFAQNQESEDWLSKIAETPDGKLKVDYYVDLGRSMLSEPQEAIKAVDKGVLLAEEIGYLSGKADLLNLIGVAHWQQNNLPKAIEYYQESLELREVGTEDEAIASNYGNIGLAHMMLGNLNAGIEAFTKCYELRRTGSNKQAFANICMNLGLGHHYVGNLEQAISLLVEAAELFELLKDQSSLATCYNNIGGIYTEIDNLKKAEEYLAKGLSLAEELGDQTSVSYCLGNLGNIYFEEKKYEKAIEYYSKVLDIDEIATDLTALTATYNGLGGAYRKLEQSDQSLFYYEKALALCEKSGNKNSKVTALLGLAELNFDLRTQQPNSSKVHVEKSVDFGEEALALALEINAKPEIEKIYYQLYLGYKARGNLENAISFHEKYKQLSDELLSVEKHEQITELESKYQLATKTREIDSLQANNRIQELELQEQAERVKAQRRLIVIGIGFTGMGVLLVLVFWQLNKTRQQNVRNELLIQNLKTEQKLLRSQMNPHFIFNSLNSIQAFISSNDSYLAEKYLAKFAKLMRGILENSFLEFVAFEKELEVIQCYLELEQVRFDHRFKFEIKIDEDFEDEFIAIPPMLIQPFLENAILHGLRDVTDCHLLVSFRETKDLVECIIDDNGVGRKKAGERKQPTNKTSLATVITDKRLDVLEGQSGIKGKIRIIDKVDEKTGDALGTRVELLIPFVEKI